MAERIMAAAFVLGSVLLLVALLRGPIKIFNVEVQSATGQAARWIAGVAGLALVGVGVYVALRSLPSRGPDQAHAGASPATASGAVADTSPVTPVAGGAMPVGLAGGQAEPAAPAAARPGGGPPPAGGTSAAASGALVDALMAVRCAALPSAVPAGQAGELVIQVSSAATPVSDADVSVEVNGGAFPSGERRVTGRTTYEGVLRARWLAPTSGGTSFLVSARASKTGYRSAGARCNVQVQPPEPPHPALARLVVGCSSNPGAIPYGTTSELVIKTIGAAHEPVPGVDLWLDGAGGAFLPALYTTLNASTTRDGVFRTFWRPPRSGGPVFTMRVIATKRGYQKTETHCEVGVDYRARPPRPPAGSLVVGCSFDPPALPFGSTGKLRVRATSAEGVPIAAASVEAMTGDGAFLASSGTRVNGRTRVDGTFSAAWTAPNSGGPVFYADVTASAPGYQPATGQCKVRVAPTP